MAPAVEVWGRLRLATLDPGPVHTGRVSRFVGKSFDVAGNAV